MSHTKPTELSVALAIPPLIIPSASSSQAISRMTKDRRHRSEPITGVKSPITATIGAITAASPIIEVEIPIHASCPDCHHWHNKEPRKFQPREFTAFRCDNCFRAMFAIGGGSSHSSLISQLTLMRRSSGSSLPRHIFPGLRYVAEPFDVLAPPSSRVTISLPEQQAPRSKDDPGLSKLEGKSSYQLSTSAVNDIAPTTIAAFSKPWPVFRRLPAFRKLIKKAFNAVGLEITTLHGPIQYDQTAHPSPINVTAKPSGTPSQSTISQRASITAVKKVDPSSTPSYSHPAKHNPSASTTTKRPHDFSPSDAPGPSDPKSRRRYEHRSNLTAQLKFRRGSNSTNSSFRVNSDPSERSNASEISLNRSVSSGGTDLNLMGVGTGAHLVYHFHNDTKRDSGHASQQSRHGSIQSSYSIAEDEVENESGFTATDRDDARPVLRVVTDLGFGGMLSGEERESEDERTPTLANP